MSGINGLKDKWEGLTPEKKRMALIGGVAAAVIGAGMFFESAPAKQEDVKQDPAEAQNMTVVAPGVSNTSAEAIAADVAALSRKLGENEVGQGQLAKESEETKKLANDLVAKQKEMADLTASVDQMRQEMVLMKSGLANPAPPLSTEINLPPVSDAGGIPPLPEGGAAMPVAPVAPPKPSIRVIGAGSAQMGGNPGFGTSELNAGVGGVSQALNADLTPPGQQVVTAGQAGQAGPQGQVQVTGAPRSDATFIPAGSIIEGVLLNGMDAPTSGVASKNPVPALLRVSKEAILPNRYRENVRECFVILAGEGELSSERAKMRSETISCVRKDGGVIEAAVDGYITGEDGKVGMRGRLVSKQGSVLAKTFVAGLAAGIAQVMTPQAVPQLSLDNNGGNQQFTQPGFGDAAQAGMYQGVSQSASQLSKFYLDMAQQMFPVIEIDAGRKATLILVRGTYLSLKPRGQQ